MYPEIAVGATNIPLARAHHFFHIGKMQLDRALRQLTVGGSHKNNAVRTEQAA